MMLTHNEESLINRARWMCPEKLCRRIEAATGLLKRKLERVLAERQGANTA